MITSHTQIGAIFFCFFHDIDNTGMSTPHNKRCLIFKNNQILLMSELVFSFIVIKSIINRRIKSVCFINCKQ